MIEILKRLVYDVFVGKRQKMNNVYKKYNKSKFIKI